MTEFLLSSTIPYWIVFALVTAAAVIGFAGMRKGKISKSSLRQVTLLALGGTLLGLAIYATLGGSSIWWCTRSEYGFFGKLLRVIPLIIFVAIQLAQVFVYKLYAEQYYQKELSIKGVFISLIVIVPAAIVLYIILDIFGLPQVVRDIIFYIILGVAFVAGVGWAMTKNVKSIGAKPGMVFTGITLVMIIGGLMSLMLLITALIQLIVQVLMVVAVVVGTIHMFGIMTKEASKPLPQHYWDNDGNMHATPGARNAANKKIADRKAQN